MHWEVHTLEVQHNHNSINNDVTVHKKNLQRPEKNNRLLKVVYLVGKYQDAPHSYTNDTQHNDT
jgi:hypothetical protein